VVNPQDSIHRIGIYADDLTGALDAAAPFAAAGMSTYVSVFGVVPDGAARTHRVLSLNINTRHADRFPVFDKAARAAQELRAAGFTLLVNKIDSTLRGHAGMEARAGLTREPSDPRDIDKQGGWRGPKLALIAPSFPAMGRTVVGGQVRVNGVPLAESEVGQDPLSPVASSEISELVDLNTGITPTSISLDDVRNGALDELVSRLMGDPPVLAVCDAETDGDLALIVAAGTNSEGDIVLSGSAGITRALARSLAQGTEIPEPTSTSVADPATPVFIVSGSQRSVTEGQLEFVAGEKFVDWLQIDPALLLSEDTEQATRDSAVARIVDALSSGQHAAVSLLRVDASDAGDDKTRTRLVRELGAICYRVVRRTRLGALVIIGGDTAQSSLRAVGSAGIVLHDEPLPGVPAGSIDGGLLNGVRVVTKAGAFGQEDVLVKVIDYLS
jgi:uncharacterized protein YgbK (DUF1537 family)